MTTKKEMRARRSIQKKHVVPYVITRNARETHAKAERCFRFRETYLWLYDNRIGFFFSVSAGRRHVDAWARNKIVSWKLDCVKVRGFYLFLHNCVGMTQFVGARRIYISSYVRSPQSHWVCKVVKCVFASRLCQSQGILHITSTL